APADAGPAPGGPLARRDDQPQWRDPASGYLRRNVSPPGVAQPLRIVEGPFPPRARVAFYNAPRGARADPTVLVLAAVTDRNPGDCTKRTSRPGRSWLLKTPRATCACTSRSGCSTA